MSVKIILEAAIEHPDYTPMLNTIELPVNYQNTRPNPIPGTVIAALRSVSQNGNLRYTLHRRRETPLFQVDEGELTIGALKIIAEDHPEFSLCYVIRAEQQNQEIKEQTGMSWIFFLTQQNDTLHLIRMKDDNPGAVDCEERVKKTCKNPDSFGCASKAFWTCLGQ